MILRGYYSPQKNNVELECPRPPNFSLTLNEHSPRRSTSLTSHGVANLVGKKGGGPKGVEQVAIKHDAALNNCSQLMSGVCQYEVRQNTFDQENPARKWINSDHYFAGGKARYW